MTKHRLIYVAGAMTAWGTGGAVLYWMGHVNVWGLVAFLWAVLASQWIAFGVGARWAGWKP